MKQKTLAIVGGGQLGRMLTEAAKNLGFYTIILDPTIDSPAGQIADEQIVGDYKDSKMIKKLSLTADYLTLEIESANAQAFIELKKMGVAVNPSGQTLNLVQDKYLQKQLLKENNIPIADFEDVSSMSEVENIALKFGYPFVLKAKRHAFDGRGNARVKNKSQIKRAIKKLKDQQLYAEKFIPFKKELAIQFVKAGKAVKIFPIVETFQKNDICHKVIAPAPISKDIENQVIAITKKVSSLLKGNGVFTIEMFLTKSGKVLVNELAPRVHNSGHYTIEACNVSQFEQHVRAVCNLPIKSAKMKNPAAAMINILGTKNAPAKLKGINSAQKIKGVSVHIYGKKQTRIDRKMGHITAVGININDALKKAELARRLISI